MTALRVGAHARPVPVPRRKRRSTRMSRPETYRRGRTLLGLLAAMLAMLGVFATPATAKPGTDAAAKIEQSVTNALAAKDSTDFWVMFGQSANTSAAAANTDWSARGTAVVDALKHTADASQAEVRAMLDAQ